VLQSKVLPKVQKLLVTKLCTKCGREKPVQQFVRHAKRADGLQVYCKECHYKIQRDWLERHPEKRAAYNEQIAERERARYARSPVYREYVKATVKAWRAVNGKKVKKSNRAQWLKQYGLTPESFEAKRQAQNNRCGCCGLEMTKPVVDHDHVTGATRDLLCYNCNVGIGLLGDTITGLETAINYLKSHAAVRQTSRATA
jgi:Recombination endonuclease VII